MPCSERDKPLAPCKEKSSRPFAFPDCAHTIAVKTCEDWQRKRERFAEGKLHCRVKSKVCLPRCGHEVCRSRD